MRRLALILFIGLLTGCGASRATDKRARAADKNTQVTDKTDDTRNWQGTWKLISATSNGETETADAQWIVDGDHYNVRLNGHTHTDPYVIKLDSSHKHIDAFHHETPKGTWGGSYKGIYELKGDSLKVCYDGKGQRYPTSFDAGPGSGQILYVLQRGR
jgi:uncharacterized protein (TIGR03067 family)